MSPHKTSALHVALRSLYYAAGAPTFREIARLSGGAVSAAGAHDMIRNLRLPKWESVEALVRALGGDPEEIQPLWEAERVRRRQGLPEEPAGGQLTLDEKLVGRMVRAGEAALAAADPALTERAAHDYAKTVIKAAVLELLFRSRPSQEDQ